MTAAGALLLLALGLSGCARLAEHAVTPVGEYAEYREFRVAETVEGKLSAGYGYLKGRPSGRYAREIRDWFHPAGRAYLRSSWDSQARLHALLRAVPAGPLADRAAGRLVELQLADEHRKARDGAFDARVRAIEERLTRADEGRRKLVSEVVGWVRQQAGIRSWGGRTSELPHEFIHAFRLSPPEARCNDSGCVKTLLLGYAVPEGRRQSQREAVVDVGLDLDEGGVVRAWVRGPELFTRLGEAFRVSAVRSGDWLARAEAIGQAAQLVALGIEPVMPASRCSAEAVSPVVLRRVCDGLELRVVSAISLDEEDEITLAPLASPARGVAVPTLPGPAAPARGLSP